MAESCKVVRHFMKVMKRRINGVCEESGKVSIINRASYFIKNRGKNSVLKSLITASFEDHNFHILGLLQKVI